MSASGSMNVSHVQDVAVHFHHHKHCANISEPVYMFHICDLRLQVFLFKYLPKQNFELEVFICNTDKKVAKLGKENLKDKIRKVSKKCVHYHGVKQNYM